MTLSDAEITEKLTREMSRHVPALYGEGHELSSIPAQRIDRRYSFMFRYWLKRPGGALSPLLVKIPHESWMETMQEAIESGHIGDVIREEYEHMTMIADAIAAAGNTELDAIRPRGVLPEFNALLMDEIPLSMLKTALTKPAIMLGASPAWKLFEKKLTLAGVWLKVIHRQYSSSQRAKLGNLDMKEKLETELGGLEKASNQPLSDLRGLFESLYARLERCDVPLACLHNDFHPGNIFITDGGKVGVLDPNWVKSGPIYDDLSTMLIYPAVRKEQVLSQGLSFRPTQQRRYERAVLEGYFGRSWVEDAMLDFFCALAVLVKWRADEDLLRSGKSGWLRAGLFVIRPFLRAYFRRLAGGYLARGLKTLNPEHAMTVGSDAAQ